MGILTGALFLGLVGTLRKWWKQEKIDLQNFDELIGNIGDPSLVEIKLQELLLQAQKIADNSIYVQMLTQIALMQAFQKKFEQAYTTLDQAQVVCRADDYVGQVRLLLERGRVFQQAGNIKQSEQYFDESYQMSRLHHLDYHTINAAHMIAIVMVTLEEKIIWNELALALALQTNNKKAAQWLAPLHNNLGQNYFDAQNYEKALYHYERALQLFENDSKCSSTNIIVARWTIARCMRVLGTLDQALYLQNNLLVEVKRIEETKQYGMPKETFYLIRGWIYEELAIIYNLCNQKQQAQEYARLALMDLADNEMFKTTSLQRIQCLQNLV